ncbi:4-hydroxy-tetrahydrodipicolinate reductase [Acidiphilium sp. JA12-A1]|uniref:4-hydroxy-tetrahydrodipicolinate reductase n=1 Tax=Acidiphilium sp. JA12-A1 TaxID=1464546 RepID=UPI000461E71C|nr:4-hydroxy-tetrahydrodipicolinate reductase [Acidiphilium sp. JA12-A1]KDM66115.1 4-hydroxy-tetrahydrodipicolinate reductase DapB [Acidiphilium sp. JA12-A1]
MNGADLRIGIAGITGRMGKLLAEAVPLAGATLAGGIGRDGDLAALARESDVVIDFTVAATVSRHAGILAAAGTPWVLGTTGFDPAAEADIADAAARIPVFQAANFAPGVNLVIALAERLGAALAAETHDAEILEMHHRQKIDAPSGTALAIGAAVARGRGVDLAAVKDSGRDGHTGKRETGAIGFAALRGGQIVGSHSAIFTSAVEQITLTHHALDRRIFAEGAVRAALWLAGHAPGRYGMRDLLGL